MKQKTCPPAKSDRYLEAIEMVQNIDQGLYTI